MSNRRKPKKRQHQSSRLKDHRQTGKILQPPMRTLPGMAMVPWLRDAFPDMIWLCSLIKLYGDKSGMMLAGQVLDRMDIVLGNKPGDAHDNPGRLVLTGELTSFDAIPEEKRKPILDTLQEDGLYERAFPWILVRGLQKYQDVPGSWLLDGWAGNTPIIGADEPETFLRTVVGDANHGQSSNATKAKAMLLRAWLQAGKISITKEIGKEWGAILPRYPDQITEEERRRIEPSIRATTLAFTAVGEGGVVNAAVSWAKQFWRQNWELYGCENDRAERGPRSGRDDAETSQQVRAARIAWHKEVDDLTERFLTASRDANPDLYIPDRHEVLTGLVYRQLRAMTVMVDYPGLWTMENGSSTIRGILETRIVVRWLILKDDPTLYARFKDYGRGRLKLLKLHLEEYRDTLDDVPPELDKQIKYMDVLVNRDLLEEFQDISIEGNFAGVDTRRMAEQVGLMTEYRLVFQPASANVHGEWTALDQYVLMTCRNPLHRWHRIPDDDPTIPLGPDLVDIGLRMMTELVDEYAEGIANGSAPNSNRS